MKEIKQVITTQSFGFIPKGTILNVTMRVDSHNNVLLDIDAKDIPRCTLNPSPLIVSKTGTRIQHSRFALV